MTLLLSETDWVHIENILGGAAFFVGFVFFIWVFFGRLL